MGDDVTHYEVSPRTGLDGLVRFDAAELVAHRRPGPLPPADPPGLTVTLVLDGGRAEAVLVRAHDNARSVARGVRRLLAVRGVTPAGVDAARPGGAWVVRVRTG